MATLYVSPLGANTSPYDTWEKAAATFKLANTAASDGDTIVLDDGDHMLSGYIGVKGVTIRNKRDDDNYQTTRFLFDDAVSTSRMVVAGKSVSIKGVSFVGSVAGYSQLSLQSNTSGSEKNISLQSVLMSGALKGAISCLVSAGVYNIFVTDCVFSGNTAETGGAIWASENNFFTFSGCVFNENIATTGTGGAVNIKSTTGNTESSFSQCAFTDNKSYGNGGAVFIADEDTIIDDCVFLRNETNYTVAGGTAGSAALNVSKFITTGNADVPSVTSITISDCLFNGNFAHAVISAPGQTVAESLIQSDGGGFQSFGVDQHNYLNIQIDDSRFCNNFSMQGAGVYISRYSNAVVSRCMIDHNTAFAWGGGSARGGGPETSEGFLTVYNYCAFVGNRAGYDRDGTLSGISADAIEGGALPVRIYPRVQINHCTFINNYVAPGGCGDAISNGSQRVGDSAMDSGLRRSSLLNCIFWNDDGVGNDVLISSLDNGWTSVNTVMIPAGQEWGAGITPITIDLAKSPVVGPDTYALKTGTRAERSAVLVEGVNDSGEADIDGNITGSLPNIGVDQLDYGVGFSPWTPFDSTLPDLTLAPTCPGKLKQVQEWKKLATAREIGRL